MTRFIKNMLTGMFISVALAVFGCSAETPADVEATLTPDESAALEEAYAIEAIETIDETNADAELQKLAQEIEADQ